MKISKKALFLSAIGIFAVSCSTSAIGSSASGSGKGVSERLKEAFLCEAPVGRVETGYTKGGEKLSLSDSSGNMYELTRSKAASGAYYKNSKASFHVKGDEALFELDGKTFSCTHM